jgi:cell fate regulator YaaT (PSP1 superfamily)
VSRKRGARKKGGGQGRVVTVSHPPLGERGEYRLSGNEQGLSRGAKVVTTGKGGVALGTVFTGPHAPTRSKDGSNEKRGQLLRVASKKDLHAQTEGEARKVELLRKTLCFIRDRQLSLRVVELFVDGLAGRVIVCVLGEEEDTQDYSGAVAELGRLLAMRVELRQLGDRDQSRLVGGVGRCGRVQCCSSHLNRYPRVSIKMAKTQGVALAQEKTSGNCGRTLCCLNYEQEFYETYHRFLPRINKRAKTIEGVEGRVVAVDVLRQTFTLRDENGQRQILPALFWDQNQGKTLPEPEVEQGALAQQAYSRLPRVDEKEEPGQNRTATAAQPGTVRDDRASDKSKKRSRSRRRGRSRNGRRDNK